MRKILAVAAAIACAGLIAACGSAPSAVSKGAATVNKQLSVLERAEPIPRLLDSADRAIQRDFYTAEADPNKIWYLETLSMTGSVEATYTIRGPVEPASDEVTNPNQVICIGESHSGCGPVGLAEPNGVYEHPGNDHIARLVSGALLKFEGQYQTSDQPFTIKTPETLTINSNAPITHTDLSKTEGGVLPPK